MNRSIVTRLPRLAAVFNTETEAHAALERFGSAMMPRSENAELDVIYAQGGWMVCVVLTGSHVGRTYWLSDRTIAAVTALEAPGGCGAARLAIIWTARSSNKKTGPMPVSTTSKETCPSVCPFKGNGCYAESGPLASLWSKMTETGPHGVFQSGVAKVRTTDWRGLCANVAALAAGTVWRHNQAGDLPHKGGRIDTAKLRALVKANRGVRGFTYTHHNVLQSAHNLDLVAWANRQGFTINLSGNNLAHADSLADLGIAPVVVVLPVDAPRVCETPKGRRVVACPKTYRDDVSCITCQLCVRARDVIVGFPAHGARRRWAGEVAEERL